MDLESRKPIIAFLTYIKNILDKFEIDYWLDSGTLLKAVRNSDIIPSSDLDFGSWQSEMDKVLLACEEFRKDGFKVKFQGGLPSLEDHVQIEIPGKYNLPFSNFDIYLYGKNNSEAFRRNIHHPLRRSSGSICLALYKILLQEKISTHNWKRRFLEKIPYQLRLKLAKFIFSFYYNSYESIWFVVPSVYFENMSKINLYNLKFKVPEDSHSYLEYRYGSTWKIPRKNWSLADGQLIRLRKINSLAKELIVSKRVESDVIIKKKLNRKPRIVFKFTKREIEKIRKLD